jgi:hypothetical protein
VNLGEIPPGEAWREVVESKRCLEEITGQSIDMISFPFGKEVNISDSVRELIPKAGFAVLFSAYGGFVSSQSDPYDIPRVAVNGHFRPLDLLMVLEGLTLPQLLSQPSRSN